MPFSSHPSITELRMLIQLVEEYEIDELEIWKWWGRVVIRRRSAAANNTQSLVTVDPPTPNGNLSAGNPEPTEDSAIDQDEPAHVVRAPLAGIFYRAPHPDSLSYVESGDQVQAGQAICMIEAMKQFNEIQAEYPGTIIKILVDNAQEVSQGQELFWQSE